MTRAGMNRPALAALAALMLLGGCAGVRQSSLNPFNWFGRSTETTATAVSVPTRVDGRLLVAQVTELAVEPVTGGAIVRAVGLPPTQGWWGAELLPENDFLAREGELSFRFVVAPPIEPRPQGSPVTREVSAGIFVSDTRLSEARRITVTGAGNARSTARR
jgi:hypothetical protein